MHWTLLDSHAGLAAATPSCGRPEETKKSNHAKGRQTWSDPSAPEIQHSQPHSGSAPVHFSKGSILNHEKGRQTPTGVGRTPPRVEIQICITILRSRLFTPTPNNTHDLSPHIADDDSHPAALGGGVRCARQRGILGLCSISRIPIQSAASPAVPASHFV
jgi:hypothetical protein